MWMALSLRLASADVSFTPVTWGTGGNNLGWSHVVGDASSITSPATGGAGDGKGFLAINFDAADPIYLFQTETVANSGPGYTGDYRNRDLGLKFSLLGYTNAHYLLYFVSSAPGSEGTWIWDLGDSAANQTWQTFTVNFQTRGAGGWDSDSTGSLLNALAMVDSIGLTITYALPDVPMPMQFGLDNWQFFVPEPGVTSMAALLLLSVVFWGRRIHRSSRS